MVSPPTLAEKKNPTSRVGFRFRPCTPYHKPECPNLLQSVTVVCHGSPRTARKFQSRNVLNQTRTPSHYEPLTNGSQRSHDTFFSTLSRHFSRKADSSGTCLGGDVTPSSRQTSVQPRSGCHREPSVPRYLFGSNAVDGPVDLAFSRRSPPRNSIVPYGP